MRVSSKLSAALLAAGTMLAMPAIGADPGITDTTIKLGMFGPLTGAVSIYGYPINNGAIAIYREINEQGGINGRKIEIVHEDGSCDPAKTRAAVKKLVHNDKVFMIHGGNCSAAVMAAKDEFHAAFKAYVEAKQRQNILDYDDLLLYLAQMAAEPDVCRDLSARFDYILIDEYQDTNRLQASILHCRRG